MSKIINMERKGFMKLLSTMAIKSSVLKNPRRKSAGHRKSKQKCKSKNRAILRPANVRCRYMSVTEEDDQNVQQSEEGRHTKMTYSNMLSTKDININTDTDPVSLFNKS